MQQVDMGLTKLQVVEKGAYKRQIEPTAIEGDQKVVALHGIFEFLHIQTVDKLVGLSAVVETDHGNFMAVHSHASRFYVQKTTTVSKISVESPAFRWRQN